MEDDTTDIEKLLEDEVEAEDIDDDSFDCD